MSVDHEQRGLMQGRRSLPQVHRRGGQFPLAGIELRRPLVIDDRMAARAVDPTTPAVTRPLEVAPARKAHAARQDTGIAGRITDNLLNSAAPVGA